MCQQEEVQQLKLAMEKRYGNKLPEYLLICAVKCHHTRFYPHSNHMNDEILAPYIEKGVELPRRHSVPGALVTEGVTFGEGKDFFLTRQVSKLGTARPTHYVVLEEYPKQNSWNLRDIAQATYDLGFMFRRCTRSVGLTAPAYLADKACDRARCYVKSQYTGHTGHEEYDEQTPNHVLNIAVHETSKNRIFYL